MSRRIIDIRSRIFDECELNKRAGLDKKNSFLHFVHQNLFYYISLLQRCIGPGID